MGDSRRVSRMPVNSPARDLVANPAATQRPFFAKALMEKIDLAGVERTCAGSP